MAPKKNTDLMDKTHQREHNIKLPTVTKREDGAGEAVVLMKFTESDIPRDILEEFGLAAHEFGDFWKALHFVTLQARQESVVDACKHAGILRGSLNSAKWKRLVGIARTMIVGQAMFQAQSVTSYVYEKWPAIIRSLVNVALTGTRDADKIDAAELLHTMYLGSAEPERNSNAEREYLSTGQSFAPFQLLQTIQAEQMVVNNFHAPEQVAQIEAPPSLPSAEDIIDAQAVAIEP